MCLLLIALQRHPLYPLVVAANRDEYYDRPTSPAGYWPESPDVLAGRDLRSGGTWLGITKTRRLAALTNFRDPSRQNPDAPSRGHLVSSFLLGKEKPLDFIERLKSRAHCYNGFNLIVGDESGFVWYSNYQETGRPLGPGIYALSNHLLDTPWPKVIKAKEGLAGILSQGRPISAEKLLQMLSDREPASDRDLPHTGIGLEWERILSPIFIASPSYGTRSSTVILMNQDSKVTFIERSRDPFAGNPRDVCYEF